MLSIGGNVATMAYPDSLYDPDPWSQGLGVIDLPSMSWASSYNANAADYDFPDMVKDWHSQGGLGRVVWKSDDVRDVFAHPNGE